MELSGRKCLIGFFRDVTERKRSEEALIESEEMFRTLTERSPNMIFINQGGRVVYANPMCEQIMGYTRKEFYSPRFNFLTLIHSDDVPTVRRSFFMHQKGKEVPPYEYKMLTKGGKMNRGILTSKLIHFRGAPAILGIITDITERKEAEEALRKSEHHFRKSIENSPMAMAIVSTKGVIEFFNQKAVKISGYLPQDLPTMEKWWVRAYPDRDYRKEAIADWTERVRRGIAAGGEIKGSEYRVTCKDRTVRTMFISGAYIAGKIVVLFDDITERKEAETLLAQREAHLSAIIENQPGMVWLKDADCRFLAVNQKFAHAAGAKSPKSMIGKTDSDFWPENLAKKYRTDDRKTMKIRKSIMVEEPILDSGVRKWYETFKTPIVNEEGCVIGTSGFARDITERRKMDAALRLAYFSINHADATIFQIDPQARLLYVNDAACRTLGYSREELLSMTIHDIDPNFSESIWKAHWNELRQKKHMNFEGTHKTKDGRIIPVDVSINFLKFEDGEYNFAFVRDISERKRAEDELKKILSLERATLESTADGILVVDGGTGKVTDFNDRFLQLWNIPKKVLRSGEDRKLLKHVVPQLKDPKSFLSKVNKLYQHPRKESFDVLEFKDGRIFERYSHPQFVDGKPVGRVWSFRDVTKQKKAEAALQSSEQRYRRIFQFSHDAMMTIEPPSWRFTSANVAMARMFKTKHIKILSHSPWVLSPKRQPDGRLSSEKAMEMIQTAIRKGAHFFEWTHRRFDGTTFPTEVLLTKVAKEHGGILIQATVRDITERKQAEDFLKEHRHQLLQIIDIVPHMIFAKDQQGRFLLVNQAVARAYGKEPRDLIGVRRQDVHKVREESESYLKIDQEILASGKSKVIPGEVFTDVHGLRHVLQTIRIPFRMVGAKEDSILGVSVDVTEQKKVEDFRNDIIRTVSHELRTPLSIEKEGISLLIDEMMGPVNTQQKEILETVMRSIDRLARMISSLLDVSSIETGKIKLSQKMTDLEPIIKDVIFEFKKRADEKSIDLSMKPGGCAVQVLMDPDKITQVLSNLVDNAIKFTPKGGTVRISLAVLKNEVECEVRDTGIGIAPENIVKAFEKFHQFARQDGPGEKGFGLGLSIAKGIVELHGGRIWIESEFGKGTRATFSLPLYQGEKDRGHV
jgi:PAS domain S-box-containing protein